MKEKCSKLMLHNFPNIDPSTKCIWCGISVKDAWNKFNKKMGLISISVTIILFSVAIILQF